MSDYNEDFLLSADFERLLEDGRRATARGSADGWLLDLRLQRTIAAERAQRRDEAFPREFHDYPLCATSRGGEGCPCVCHFRPSRGGPADQGGTEEKN